MNVAALACTGLGKAWAADWRGGREKALADVHVQVPAGSVCGIVGPNGAGKSTLLRLCAGLLAPTSGSCAIFGRGPDEAARQGQIGYAAEHVNYPGFLTAGAMLIHLAKLTGATDSVARSSAQEALASVGLAEAGSRRIGQLSKGQKQRLSLAQAALGQPDLLLLDEPAAGLDPRAMDRFESWVTSRRTEGRTVVFTSHFLPQTESLCDRLVLLDRGRVLLNAGREEVARRGGLAEVFLELTRP